MPAYPVSNAAEIMEMIFEEHEDNPDDVQCQDAADAGYLMPRGQAVVLRVGNLPSVMLAVSVENMDEWRAILDPDYEDDEAWNDDGSRNHGEARDGSDSHLESDYEDAQNGGADD